MLVPSSGPGAGGLNKNKQRDKGPKFLSLGVGGIELFFIKKKYIYPSSLIQKTLKRKGKKLIKFFLTRFV